MGPEPLLAQFLAHLAVDSEQSALFASSQTEAVRLMTAAGLNADEQRALGSGDMAAVYAALANQADGEVWNAAPYPVKGRPKPSPGKPKKTGSTKPKPTHKAPKKK